MLPSIVDQVVFNQKCILMKNDWQPFNCKEKSEASSASNIEVEMIGNVLQPTRNCSSLKYQSAFATSKADD